MKGDRQSKIMPGKPRKWVKAKAKQRLQDVRVEEFAGARGDSDSAEEQGPMEQDVSDDSDAAEGEIERDKPSVSKHKASLAKLKEQDPEFYKFLESESKELLNFEDSGSDSEEDSSEEKYHKPPQKLEVASDDSEAEESEEEAADARPKPGEATKKGKKKEKSILVTSKLVKKWSQSLQEANSLRAIHCTVSAFKAAVQQAGHTSGKHMTYRVEGATVFNAIVRLCVTDLLPAWQRLLKMPKQKDATKPPVPSSGQKWGKVKIDVKSYLVDMIQLLAEMSEAAILNVLLKHIHQLLPFYISFPAVTRTLLKKLIELWSSAEETTRVLAFLCINRITRWLQDKFLEHCVKKMYMAYVKNCKFTSPTSLPMINFMQRSLVEMFAIDQDIAYQYAFVYIRQLAIHLRNAITMKKKDTHQTVYNWQYIHSLHLFARLLSTMYPSSTMEPLIYPLTQTIIGTIKLVPTAKFYPLRFHCVRALNILQETTRTFIPVLPFLLEVFELTDFNKRHKSASFKPVNFACALKLSNAQLEEKGFRDGLIDQLFEHLLETFHIHAHTVGFPEVALPALMQLKVFLKNCKVANYTKQIKQIVEKVEETNKVITQRRKTATLSLTDTQGLDTWERKSKEEGTPLGKYYATWRKLRDRELQHEIAGKDRISHDNLPEIERKKGAAKATEEDKREFGALFDSQSEEESDDETRFLPKGARPVKKQKTAAHEDDDDSSEYSDLDSDELAELAESAEDEEEDSSDNEEQSEQGKDSDVEEGEDEDSDVSDNEDSDVPDKEDIVEDFQLSSDED